MIRNPQDLADEIAAERAYADMLAHPETVADGRGILAVTGLLCTDYGCPRAHETRLCGPVFANYHLVRE